MKIFTYNKMMSVILIGLISFMGYGQYDEDKQDTRVKSEIAYNLTNHVNAHVSKVVSTGYDFSYGKNSTSLWPTYLLEDGMIIHESQIDESTKKFAPFVKVGDYIEYTKSVNHDLRGDYDVFGAHIVGR